MAIVYDTLRPGLRELMPRIDAAVSVAFDAAEKQAATYARANASWTDRTGNARNGLDAKHVGQPLKKRALIIFHKMPYGFWLEVRWSGRYAIIGPTLAYMTPELKRMIVASVRRATS